MITVSDGAIMYVLVLCSAKWGRRALLIGAVINMIIYLATITYVIMIIILFTILSMYAKQWLSEMMYQGVDKETGMRMFTWIKRPSMTSKSRVSDNNPTNDYH